MMKILLIAPASKKWQSHGAAHRLSSRAFRFSLLSLLTVAAATPEQHDIRIVDEQVEGIPYGAEADLVGIGCMTALAPRAYEIADEFRRRGRRVVLGGMHPTFLPREALLHADAVVAGEVEDVWPQLLADVEAGRMAGLYRSETPPDLAKLRVPPRHLLKRGTYATVNAIQATRGCPKGCQFCSVRAFSSGRQRQRPVDAVARELQSLSGSLAIFVDDNLTADRDYAMALFRALEPVGKLWVTQASLGFAKDEELVKAAARAGCFGVFAGIETFSQSNLAGVQKSFNRVDEYRELIGMLHHYGIGVEAGIVFGFDGDTPETFEDTLHQLDDLKVDMLQASIMTPLPGTGGFEALRPCIFDLNWEHYDFHTVVFEPKGMTAEELQMGHDWMTRAFYGKRRIAKRLENHLRRPRGARTLKWTAMLNLAYRQRILGWGLRGENPARRTMATA
jgi:radical SAM superfamily enzyme YgiQ (UPF0313 family)